MGVAAALLEPTLRVLESLKSLGLAGRLLYVLILTIWVVFCGPTTPIELASGFVFPIALSTALSVAGKTAGNLLAFVLGRRVLKPIVARMLSAGSGASASVHHHLLTELRQRPIQTMSILRAAPLPTPFKIYGLCLFPSDLVPLWSYALIALIFNTCWSVVWALAGSSASNLQDVLNGEGSSAALATQFSTLLVAFSVLVFFGRFAAAKIQPPSPSPPSDNAAARDESPSAHATPVVKATPRAAVAMGRAASPMRSRSRGRAASGDGAPAARMKSPRAMRSNRGLS